MVGHYACPRCFGALPQETAQGGGFFCAACEAAYPVLGGVACLVPDPALFRRIWKGRLDDYLSLSEGRLARLRDEASAPGLLGRTRARIERVSQALELDRKTIAALLSDFVPAGEEGVPALFPSADARLEDPPLLRYSEHLFRDWAWGDENSERALSFVRLLLPGTLGKVAVYGVGSGRLALDIHRSLGPEWTLGLDVNPLPLIVGARLLSGDEVELHEFPLAPHTDDVVAVRQRLRSPVALPSGLALAFADALNPPLAPGSLDTVVTPWFIDAVGTDLRSVAAAVNRVLRPGGRWLNFGPLRFTGPLAAQYLEGEVHEIVESSSFALAGTLAEDLPYFRSPFSGTARVDRVFAFAAEKTGEASAPEPAKLFAPWLTDTSLPIPAGKGLAVLRKKSVLTIGIVSMIDGRRSIRDLARDLGAQWGVPPSVVEEQLAPFLASLPID